MCHVRVATTSEVKHKFAKKKPHTLWIYKTNIKKDIPSHIPAAVHPKFSVIEFCLTMHPH